MIKDSDEGRLLFALIMKVEQERKRAEVSTLNSSRIFKKKIIKWKKIDVKQLLIDVSLHSKPTVDGKDEQFIMIRQYNPSTQRSSQNMGEVVLLDLAKLQQFKESLDDTQYLKREQIDIYYKAQLTSVYAKLMKEYLSDIVKVYKQNDNNIKENQKIIQVLQLNGTLNEKVSLCIDDLFNMVDINQANELAFDQIKLLLLLPIKSKDLFLSKDVLEKDLDWLIGMRRNLIELIQSEKIDIALNV